MPRGPKKHLKLLNAPSSWMLSKLSGIFAPKPIAGPHSLRECIPLILILRNKLGFALNAREVEMICKQRLIKVDNKIRTEKKFPIGFMDVLKIERTGDNYRTLYDTKGRFCIKKITEEESSYKLLKVKNKKFLKQGVPVIYCHDGRSIRYPPFEVSVGDTIKYDLNENKVTAFFKLKKGNLVMVTGGQNTGRVGQVIKRESHPGSFEIIHVKDIKGNTFCTREQNIFVIGEGNTASISLPKGKGLKLTTAEERKRKMKKLEKTRRGKYLKKKKTETKTEN